MKATDERFEWIDKRLGQLGIDIRQSGAHLEMRRYLELLTEEIKSTETFLSEDGYVDE